MSLVATTFDWQVAAGSQVLYKGTGMIDKRPHGFLISVLDGGAAGKDAVRVKIWDVGTGDVVYDTQRGAAEDAIPTTVLKSGNISIAAP
jgi:prolyl oligopeptidase PreP (S9A serine peptidase family)